MPRIGIFWVYRGTVLGKSIALEDGEQGVPGLLDSPDSHSDLWETDKTLLRNFPELCGQEYFSVPRGRVLWQVESGSARIYLDKRLLESSVQQKIIEYFDLGGRTVVWSTDPHYVTDVDSG